MTVYTTEWAGEEIPGVHVEKLLVNKKKTRKRDVEFAHVFQKLLNHCALIWWWVLIKFQGWMFITVETPVLQSRPMKNMAGSIA